MPLLPGLLIALANLPSQNSGHNLAMIGPGFWPESGQDLAELRPLPH